MCAFGGVPRFLDYSHDDNVKIAQFFIKEPEYLAMFIEGNKPLL